MGAFDINNKKQPNLGLFVGVERYEDRHIRNLFNCLEDAKELCKIFFNEEFDSNHWILLTDNSATRKSILKSLVKLMNKIVDHDFLVVFVSTHGIIEFNDYFFFPYDAELDNILGTGISASLLINGLASLARKKAIKVLLIFDTCHSGGIGFDYGKLNGEISCIFSSSVTELSYEKFNDEHGVFTKSLLDGLRGKAVNDQGNVTLRNLFNYTYKEVQRNTNKRQNPILIGNMDNKTVLRHIPSTVVPIPTEKKLR